MMLKQIFSLTLAILIIGVVQSKAEASNVSISNVTLTSPDATNDTIQVQFNISWDYSWRDSNSRDAVWVFMKYSTDSGTTWNQAILKTSGTNPSGFSTGTGTDIDIVVSSDLIGAFIERSSDAEGAGSVSVSSVQLVWNYGASGLADSGTARIKVCAIEMVYIPTGNFYIGDGDGSSESTRALHVTDNTAVQITTTSVSNVTVDTNADDDIDTTPIAIDGDGGITGNSSFPTGYNAFYLMKYEISQQQWVEFFNTLTSAQKTNRDITDATGKNSDSTVERNTISWATGDASYNSRGDRACSYLSWMDLCAYADWAGLRPMTELEFEKACRGPALPLSGEYPWGSTDITVLTVGVSGSENGTETVADDLAAENCNYNSTTITGGDADSKGPLRNGFFARLYTSRNYAAAGFYGNMELAGNVMERVVSLGNSTGRSFSGTHGDGVLTSTASYEGNATNTDWPGIDGTTTRGVTGATGSGQRGGGYDSASTACRISDRSASATTSTARTNHFGGRLARTAP